MFANIMQSKKRWRVGDDQKSTSIKTYKIRKFKNFFSKIGEGVDGDDCVTVSNLMRSEKRGMSAIQNLELFPFLLAISVAETNTMIGM